MTSILDSIIITEYILCKSTCTVHVSFNEARRYVQYILSTFKADELKWKG